MIYNVIWEERYKIKIEAKSKEEARDKFEALGIEEMRNAYQETTFFEIEKYRDL